jgi:hypothetical protein
MRFCVIHSPEDERMTNRNVLRLNKERVHNVVFGSVYDTWIEAIQPL